MLPVVEGLLTEPVACEPELRLMCVPAPKRKHALCCFQGRRHPVSGYVLDQNLGVRVTSPTHRSE